MKLVTEFTVTFLLLIQKCAATATQKTFSGTDKYDVTMLTGSTTIERNSLGKKQGVDVYCYPGTTKSLIRTFQTVKFHVHIRSDEFRQYIGGTPGEVYSQYMEDSYGWSINPFSSQRPKSSTIDPFNRTCLAVNTKEMHGIELQVIGVDLWRVLIMVAGLSLFFMSRTLSNNPLFFYLCGVIVGVCASFMVLVYYVSKLCPRKMLTYGVMIGGWTVGAFIFQQVWTNVSALVLSYRTHVFWYTLVASVVSFAVCYRIGPPKNERSKNLVMWVLQLIGLLLVFFCSNYQEASAAIVITSLTVLYFPQSLQKALKGYWLSHFPPTRRLLSNEEYYAEGARETKHALDNLREYCKSPDCAQWRIVRHINDSKRSPNASSSPSDWDTPDRRNIKVNTSSRSDWKSPDRRNTKVNTSSRSDWESLDHRNPNPSLSSQSDWKAPDHRNIKVNTSSSSDLKSPDRRNTKVNTSSRSDWESPDRRNTKVNTSSRSDWESPDHRNPNPNLSSQSDWKAPDHRNTKVNTSSRSDWESPDRRNPNPYLSSQSDWEAPDHRNQKACSSSRSDSESPDLRFASFVEGDSHLNDNEVMDYEAYAFSLNQGNVSSDDSPISSDEEY